MIFSSFEFMVFFALTFAAYWLARGAALRRMILLVGSMAFYGWWDYRFLALLWLVIGSSYLVARFLDAPGCSLRARRWALGAGVAVQLGVLAAFKYFDFFIDNAVALVEALGMQANAPTFRFILPIGVSFYVFQAISYMGDVYSGKISADRRLTRVALFISFFPQLVAGPIVRAAKFFPQMERVKRLRRARLASAGHLFLKGFIYKALIADNLAPLADPVFANMDAYSNLAVVGATLAFAGQIYFDFAGYSLMAIGVARAFGYYIPPNFRYPFAAASVTEYWRRWHISLSGFLRDYLFKPLGGNRGSRSFYYRNLMITMVLGGLWHGAAWTFVLWGFLQGVALVLHKEWIHRVERPLRLVQRIPAWAYWTFGLFVTQLFIVQQRGLFRAEDITDGLAVFGAFAGVREGGGMAVSAAVWLVPLIIALDAVIGLRRRLGLSFPALATQRPVVFWCGMGALTALALSIYPLQAAPFVYFQF